jgi:transcriptional regulator with XRE-family HTH domain
MNELRLSENIARLRKEKKNTQEELADFIGVTKASVSKWENGQSMPDILLLPQLATYFNVTLDALLGYEPQLGKEQIQHMYHDFAAAFAARPFGDVLAEVRAAIRQYYACYPFLLQMCILYLNHIPMAKNPGEMQNLFKEAGELCEHILRNCKSVSICADAASVKAIIDLQLGKADDVIAALEPVQDPLRLSKQDDVTLIQAYRLSGKMDQAIGQTQLSIYLKLLALVGVSAVYLSVNDGERASCEETISRVDGIVRAYHLEQLHPNVTAQFQYQAALVFASFGEHEKALERLEAYSKAIHSLMSKEHPILHGDDYFTRLAPWFERLALGPDAPRDKALIRQSIVKSLDHPAFEPLRSADSFKAIQKTLAKE